jgi:hypothetical protein
MTMADALGYDRRAMVLLLPYVERGLVKALERNDGNGVTD